jgi:glycosyltransferase involved in cell wall biosynthesis
MFFETGLSKLGSSPTRMGEILGCGLPIITNDGVGDVSRIIRKYRVGVLVDGLSSAQMSAALNSLDILMTDPDLSSRCRAAAEDVFSLKVGTQAYCELYRAVLIGKK